MVYAFIALLTVVFFAVFPFNISAKTFFSSRKKVGLQISIGLFSFPISKPKKKASHEKKDKKNKPKSKPKIPIGMLIRLIDIRKFRLTGTVPGGAECFPIVCILSSVKFLIDALFLKKRQEMDNYSIFFDFSDDKAFFDFSVCIKLNFVKILLGAFAVIFSVVEGKLKRGEK